MNESAAVNGTDGTGATALMYAAAAGHTTVVFPSTCSIMMRSLLRWSNYSVTLMILSSTHKTTRAKVYSIMLAVEAMRIYLRCS